MTDTQPPTDMDLSAFAAANPGGQRKGSYLDTLPADVRAQVADSFHTNISAATVARWLQARGYDKASPGMVDRWRRGHAHHDQDTGPGGTV